MEKNKKRINPYINQQANGHAFLAAARYCSTEQWKLALARMELVPNHYTKENSFWAKWLILGNTDLHKAYFATPGLKTKDRPEMRDLSKRLKKALVDTNYQFETFEKSKSSKSTSSSDQIGGTEKVSKPQEGNTAESLKRVRPTDTGGNDLPGGPSGGSSRRSSRSSDEWPSIDLTNDSDSDDNKITVRSKRSNDEEEDAFHLVRVHYNDYGDPTRWFIEGDSTDGKYYSMEDIFNFNPSIFEVLIAPTIGTNSGSIESSSTVDGGLKTGEVGPLDSTKRNRDRGGFPNPKIAIRGGKTSSSSSRSVNSDNEAIDLTYL